MSEITLRPTASTNTTHDDSAIFDKFLELTATRNVNTLLRQALALLVQSFGAEAGSLLFHVNPPDAEFRHPIFEPGHDPSGEATHIFPVVVLRAESDRPILPQRRRAMLFLTCPGVRDGAAFLDADSAGVRFSATKQSATARIR